MSENHYIIDPVGVVRSSLSNRETAPLQGDEGGVEAWVEFSPQLAPALAGINVGDKIILLTWFHQADRDVLQVHPRSNPANPLTGVFATRSPDRPNPIGLHQVTVLEITAQRLRVAPLEAIDGTPVIDVKPVIGSIDER
jgi:tRNA-Thr(GGU) m(6)t(6)A37 methyltransferase TsaA